MPAKLKGRAAQNEGMAMGIVSPKILQKTLATRAQAASSPFPQPAQGQGSSFTWSVQKRQHIFPTVRGSCFLYKTDLLTWEEVTLV